MRRCLRDIALLVAIVICCAAAGIARADGRGAMAPAAKAELDRGLERFKAKDYAGAIAAFDAGYAIDAKPEFLYVKAQAQRLSGDCRKAIETYLAYLATHPPDDKVEYANANIERCERQLAAAPGPSDASNEPSESEPVEQSPAGTNTTPATAAPATGARPATTTATATRQQGEEPEGGTSRWRDRRGLWLAGSAAVALGIGVTFTTLARSAANDAGEAQDLEGWEASRDVWARDRRIAEVATVVGVGLGAVAAIRFARVKEPKRRVAIGVGAGPSTGVLVIGGRW
jgi:tetratricopeptide (TPR) repeat protein